MRALVIIVGIAALSLLAIATLYLAERGWDKEPTPILKPLLKFAAPPPPAPRSVEQCEHDYDSAHHVPVIPGSYLTPELRIVVYRLSGDLPDLTRHVKNTFLDFPIREKHISDKQLSQALIDTLNNPSSYSDCSCFCNAAPLMAFEIQTPGREPIKIWVDGFFHYVVVMDHRKLDFSRRGYASIVSIYNRLFPRHAVKQQTD